MTTSLGSFVEGEIPEPLEYQFLDADGDPLNLTGYTATFHTRINTVETDLAATVSTPLEGKVTHVWLDGELERQGDRGSLRCQFKVTNGTNVYYSERLSGFIARAIREPA